MEFSATDEVFIEIAKSDKPIRLNQLNPYYPNEKYGEGFGKALAFALRYLLSKTSLTSATLINQ